MRRFFTILVGFFLIYDAAMAQATPTLEVITLRHRMADQVLPQLLPFVEPGGALTGMNEKLFLRASARNQAEIRKLAAELDAPLRRLMISVRQEGEEDAAARGSSVAGGVTVIDGKVGTGGTARVYSSSRASSDRVNQQVQTIDGGRAAIHVGQSFWVPLRQIVVGPGGAIISESFVQRDLGTGFVATPRLSGNRVTIDVSPRHDTAGSTPLSTQVERLVTTVSGPLGEWLVLGGSAQDEAGQGSGTRWGTQSASRQRRLLLKVEALPD
jgi:type II secretory pathway component GspD/PulD (secretin)